jgi:hypothetical protein
MNFTLSQKNINKYLKVSRYLPGFCSSILFLFGIFLTIFIPPLLILFPLFIYLIYLNCRDSSRAVDQLNLTSTDYSEKLKTVQNADMPQVNHQNF